MKYISYTNFSFHFSFLQMSSTTPLRCSARLEQKRLARAAAFQKERRYAEVESEEEDVEDVEQEDACEQHTFKSKCCGCGEMLRCSLFPNCKRCDPTFNTSSFTACCLMSWCMSCAGYMCGACMRDSHPFFGCHHRICDPCWQRKQLKYGEDPTNTTLACDTCNIMNAFAPKP